eukprot:COSAG02_NODE_4069_length_5831_cov_3.564778_2_plen_789_part_00
MHVFNHMRRSPLPAVLAVVVLQSATAGSALLPGTLSVYATARLAEEPSPLSLQLSIVQDRVLQSLLPQTSAESAAAVRIAKQMQAALDRNSGTWPDLDYKERKRAGWPLLKHLNRVTSMAAAWACPLCTTHRDPRLLNSTLLALRYWLRTDPQDPNWYQMQIATPRELGKTGVLLRGELSLADTASMVTMLLKANPAHKTGANQVDMYRIQIMRGVIQANATLIAEAFGATFAGVKYYPQSGDSFMRDHSFHQHGPQLLPAVYGAVIAADTMALAGWAEGTPSAISSVCMKVFEGYVLDGLAWMVTSRKAGAVWDWQVAGRRVTIPYTESEWKWLPSFRLPAGCSSGGQGCMEIPMLSVGLEPAAMRQLASSSKRASEWLRLANLIESGETTRTVVGNRQYFDSDFVAHSRPGYLFTVHMKSARTIGAACVNDEGKLNRHLSDGGTALHLDGSEYDRIFPCWNWSRPPGTTVAVVAKAPDCNNAKAKTDATFVGSASDGEVGVAGQTLQGSASLRDVSANKSWFMFDTAIACCGSTAEDAVTTIEQSNLQGVVIFSQNGAAPTVLGASQRSFNLSAGPMWVHHHGTGYLIPRTANAVAHLSGMVKHGNWSDISNDAESGQTPLPDGGGVSLPVFDLFITHHNSGYGYIVLPGTALASMQHLSETAAGLTSSWVDTGTVYHAVADKDRLLVVAWSVSTIRLADWEVTPSRASMFVLQSMPDGTVGASASVPDAGGELHLVVKAAPHWSGSSAMGVKSCTLRFNLLDGDELGKSVSASCTPSRLTQVIRL